MFNESGRIQDMKITTDNAASSAGYTKQYIACFGATDIHISVKPDTDLDSAYKAFDHDSQEMIYIDGWTTSLESVGVT